MSHPNPEKKGASPAPSGNHNVPPPSKIHAPLQKVALLPEPAFSEIEANEEMPSRKPPELFIISSAGGSENPPNPNGSDLISLMGVKNQVADRRKKEGVIGIENFDPETKKLLHRAVKKNKKHRERYLVSRWNIFNELESSEANGLQDEEYQFAYFTLRLQGLMRKHAPGIYHGQPDAIFGSVTKRSSQKYLAWINKNKQVLLAEDQQNQVFLASMLESWLTLQANRYKSSMVFHSINFASHNLFEKIASNRLYAITAGYRGNGVGVLQLSLKALKYLPENHKVSDYFDKATRNALRSFQKENPIKGKYQSGYLDRPTLRALDQRWASNQELSQTGYAGSGKKYKVFQIEVFESISFEKDTAHAFSEIFAINPSIPSKPEFKTIFAKALNDLKNARKSMFSPQEIKQGHANVVILEEVFNQITSELIKRGIVPNQKQTSAVPALQESMLNLEDKGKLYDMEKILKMHKEEVLHLKTKKASNVSIDEKRLESLEKNVKLFEVFTGKEYLRLGISPAEFELMKTRFKAVFENVAVETGKEMLNANRHRASAFEDMTKGSSAKLTKLKKLLLNLGGMYAHSNDLKEKWVSDNWPKLLAEMVGLKKIPFAKIGAMINNIAVPAHYFLEPDSGQPALQEWAKQERSIYQMIQVNLKEFPILAHPTFDLKDTTLSFVGRSNSATGKIYAGLSKKDRIRSIPHFLKQQAQIILENISKVKIESEDVWKYQPIVQRTKEKMGISPKSIYSQLLTEWQEEASDDTWETVAGWGLAIASFASGPLGWMAATGSVILGAKTAADNFSDTLNQHRLVRASLGKDDQMLGEAKSWSWFALDLLSLGLDLGDAIKLTKKLFKSKAGLKQGADLTQKQFKNLKNEAADLLKQGAGNKGKIKELLEMELDVMSFLRRLKAPFQVSILLKSFKNTAFRKAFFALKNLLSKDQFSKFFHHVVGAGKHLTKEIPETLRLLKASGLSKMNKWFMPILTQPTIRRLYLAKGQQFILKQWKEFQKLMPFAAGAAAFTRFGQWLSSKFAGAIRKHGFDGIGKKFGKDFHKLPMKNKNLLLLREGRFGTFLDDLHNQRKISAGFRKKFKAFLERDHIKLTLSDSKAVRRLEDAFENFMSVEMTSMKDFLRASKLGALAGFQEQAFAGVAKGEWSKLFKRVQKKLPESFEVPQNIEKMKELILFIYQKKNKTKAKGKFDLKGNPSLTGQRLEEAFLHLMKNPDTEIEEVLKMQKKKFRFDYAKGKLAEVVRVNWKSEVLKLSPKLKPKSRDCLDWIRKNVSPTRKDKNIEDLIARLFRNHNAKEGNLELLDDILEAIYDLRNAEGLGKLVDDLANRAGGITKILGAQFVLHHATEKLLSKMGKGAKVSFEKEVTSGFKGLTRKYDVVVDGKHLEYKNWSSPRSADSYLKLSEKAAKQKPVKGSTKVLTGTDKWKRLSEFEHDILNHAETNFNNFGFVISKDVLQADPKFKQTFFDKMKKRFNDPDGFLQEYFGGNATGVWGKFEKAYWDEKLNLIEFS